MNVGMLVSNEVVRDTRVLLEARGLARHGHRVRVVGWDRFDPTAKDGPVEEGVDVELVRNRGLLRALPVDLLRNPVFWRRAFRRSLRWPADLWWAHDLDTLPAGVWLKERTGRPLVFDAHEVFAEMIAEDYPKRLVRAAETLEARLLRHVDTVVTVNPVLEAHYKRSGRPVTVVMNCRDPLEVQYAPPTAPAFTVLYVGTFHASRFVFELIQAVQETEGVSLRIGGHKALTGEVRRRCAASERTTFLGPVPGEQVLPLTRECHVVCALLDPANANNRKGTPNKLFEAMAAGRPVLATKGTLSGDIVDAERCGLVIPYRVDACKAALVQLRDNPDLQRELGQNALHAAQTTYNWPVQERALLAVVNRFAARTSA